MSTWTYHAADGNSMKSGDCFLSCCQVRDKKGNTEDIVKIYNRYSDKIITKAS